MAAPRARAVANPFVSLLKKVSRAVEPRLLAVLSESEARGSSYAPEAGHMVAAVRSLCLRGGKRLRPGLCVVGAMTTDPVSADAYDVAIEAGVALELLQAYFLLHDDWMDQDDERRGGPTAHVELAKKFRSSHLGACGAILAGDHAVALAQKEMLKLKLSPARRGKCLEHLVEMQLAAVFGQQIDVRGTTRNPELTYELKTASYTVRGPLMLGAEIAGADQQARKVLEAYSLPAGIAFQLRDDLIGVFGAPDVTGKPQGGDLKEGKNTVLVRHGKNLAKGSERARLQRVLGNRRATRAQVRTAISVLENCGAKEAVEARILDLKAQSLAALQGGGISKKSAKLLGAAVSALADRTT